MLQNSLDSNQKLIESIVKNRKLTVGAKALYFYLINIKNTEFPSRNKIAYDLNISNVTLGKYLKELIQNRYIKCYQSKSNGRFQNNYYTIKIGE